MTVAANRSAGQQAAAAPVDLAHAPPPATEPPPTTLRTVVGILGTVRCGSTPLGMALGSHPDAAFVGETHHATPLRINGCIDRRGVRPVCAACGASCPVWKPESMPEPLPGLHARLAERVGRPIIVDSSKYVSSFLAYEAVNAGTLFVYVVLIKSPERQIASFRRYGSVDPQEWLRAYLGEYAAIRSFLVGRRFLIYDYEAFATGPASVLQAIGALAGVGAGSFDAAHYPEAHQLPGNDRAIASRAPITVDTWWREYAVNAPVKVLSAMRATYDAVLGTTVGVSSGSGHLGGARHRVYVVRVGCESSWNKWPHTADSDFSGMLQAHREYDCDGVHVIERLLPIAAAYRAIGFAEKPPGFPGINNTLPVRSEILTEQLALLKDASRHSDVIWWEHAHQCAPAVAVELPSLFHQRVLAFGDDCPGSSEIKTFPVCRWFTDLYYSMFVWSFDTGQEVGALYRDRGVARTWFRPSTESPGLRRRIAEDKFDVRAKIRVVAAGDRLAYDLVYVGLFGGFPWRRRLLHELSRQRYPAEMRTRFHGVCAPDGILEPRVGPEGSGHPLLPLYARALFGVNPQQSSVFNTRLPDLWLTGVGQLIHDPHGELERNGFRPGEHYVSFDGTAEDLWRQVRWWRERPIDLGLLLERARCGWIKYAESNSVDAVHGRIYRAGMRQ